MYQLIVGAVAAALLVIAGLAGINYLGPMFMDNTARVELATYLNRGAQIHGALRLYQAENNGASPAGTGPEQVMALVNAGYLQSAPDQFWSIDTQMVFRDIKTSNECVRLNAAANMDLASPAIVAYHGCPPCSDPAFSGYPACTKETNPVASGGS